ncbi:MAG TPA: sulfur transferase domain-containing protein [Vicinamibacterales bacterium]|nr:sulfur transferase domain-containing protein [Vicinamibacterales bacterium]
MRSASVAFVAALVVCGPAPTGRGVHASPQQVIRESREGIKNFARVETTVACAGAIAADAMSDIRKMGFASVINLREVHEAGAEIEKQEAAARAAGLRYYHLPLNSAKPDEKVADQFVKVIASADATPAFIHCASANRASAMWLIKRIAIDKWDVDRAMAEAEALGLTNPALKTWALEYARGAR